MPPVKHVALPQVPEKHITPEMTLSMTLRTNKAGKGLQEQPAPPRLCLLAIGAETFNLPHGDPNKPTFSKKKRRRLPRQVRR